MDDLKEGLMRSMAEPAKAKIIQNPLEEMKAEKIHLNLTLADVDALHKAGIFTLNNRPDFVSDSDFTELEVALSKLDEAVNG